MNEIVGQSKDSEQSLQVIEQIAQIGQALTQVSEQFTNHENRIEQLEDTMRVNGVQELRIDKAVKHKVVSYLGGKDSRAYADRSLRARTFGAINREIKLKFGIPRRAELPAKDYQQAMAFIDSWMIDKVLADEIRQVNQPLKVVNQ